MADITNCTNNTSTYANNTIPQLSSDDLNIQSWERMDHGGHSFVFKVSIDDGVSAIKIVCFFNIMVPHIPYYILKCARHIPTGVALRLDTFN